VGVPPRPAFIALPRLHKHNTPASICACRTGLPCAALCCAAMHFTRAIWERGAVLFGSMEDVFVLCQWCTPSNSPCLHV
jgi:hypothetical protein